MPKPEQARIYPRLNVKGQIHSPLVRSISDPTQIDEENGVLKNVLLCQSMQPKGYAGYFQCWDEEREDFVDIPIVTPIEFIDKLVELSANFREKGQKARFGHPAMCEQEAGMHCGWIRNIRKEGDGAVGDIYLADFADLSPKGTLKSYVLKAAQEDPEALMMSIVFSPGPYYFIENGQRVDFTWYDDVDDRILALPEEERIVFESVSAWHYTDFVSEGANTNNLFRGVDGQPMNAALVTDFLDKNPGIYDMLTKSPEIVDGFLKKYEAHKARTISKQIKQMSKPNKNWLQRSADWLTEKMSGGNTVSARNIDATTSDGVGITILTDSDVPAPGDQVQVTETGEAPPAAVHTIAGGDLDGYQITTDETGAITEVVAPEAAAEEEQTSETVSAEEIRGIVADVVAKAIAPLQTEMKSLKGELEKVKTSPLLKRTVEAGRQTPVNAGKKSNAEIPAWEKEMIEKSERFAGKKSEETEE